ncbi:MAG: DNA polymerase III subunit delta' [Clostridia bacterium]|nr:DNA polymerase III subunit delta' [Clostridia bacterium]
MRNRTITLEDFLVQGDEIRHLLAQQRSGRLSHALLITGPDGVGKKTLATLLSAQLFCGAERNRPCLECPACKRAMRLEHADQVVIRRGIPLSPDVKEGRATIPVEDIREMIRICGMAPFEGGNRSVLIFDADTMTPQAQNALLKTLEEPPENTFFFLVTGHPESLVNTIISRCRLLRLHPLPDETIRSMLLREGVSEQDAATLVPLADGSIGKAMQMAQQEGLAEFRKEVLDLFFGMTRRSDILPASNRWKNRKGEADALFTVLESMLHRMMNARFGSPDNGLSSVLPAQWNRFTREAPAEAFTRLYDQIIQARKELQYSTNFQAVFEQILFSFMGEGNQWL